jgi:hypothetical protein
MARAGAAKVANDRESHPGRRPGRYAQALEAAVRPAARTPLAASRNELFYFFRPAAAAIVSRSTTL